MSPFTYERAGTAADALQLASSRAAAKYLGGGTNLIDLMRETVERPSSLIDVSCLPKDLGVRENGSLHIGAAMSNTALASHPLVRERLPMLSRAILAGASAQIRNMATVGGNILQRTRCTYFYDEAARCNKRSLGAGCDAIGGFNRYHAVLGASPDCIATHPSDMCVALVALDALIHTLAPTGPRSLPLSELHRLPADRPDLETELLPQELITAVEIPPLPGAMRSTYRKVRDRASYAFALVSVAAAIEVLDGTIREVRLALGGVAPRPWRAHRAEAVLRGRPPGDAAFAAAAAAELGGAVGLRDNQFKIDLAKRTLVATLSELAGGRP